MNQLPGPVVASSSILVVDEDLQVSLAVRTVLEDAGFLVATAINGTGAWETTQRNRPALIVLERHPPWPAGKWFVRRLRQQPRRCVPILLVSADRGVQKAEEIGSEGWLEKPFGVAELLAAIGRLVGM